MPANYKYYDSLGLLRTVSNVLDPLELTSVEVNSGSSIITVDETSVVYPGQPISGFGIPLGCFVHSVRKEAGNPTQLTLWSSSFNLTTGVWSTAATNATASATNITALVSGFCPFTIVSLAYAMGMWRNLHSSNTGNGVIAPNGSNVELAMHETYGVGVALVPTAGTWTTGVYVPTAADVRVSDSLASTPLKRHNGELHGAYVLVSSNGHKSVVQALPGREILYSPS